MGIKVGINGFGRIGRNIMRAAMGGDIDFVAVNDITDTNTLAHLLKYDSVLGNLDADIRATDKTIRVNDDEFVVFAERDPATKAYRLGVDAMQLGFASMRRVPLVDSCRPLMQKLARMSGDTVFLVIRQGDYCLCLHREEGTSR